MVSNQKISRSRFIFGLPERPAEVLNLMSQGCGNSEIADQLFIDEGTVQQHINVIYQTLHITGTKRGGCRVQAVLMYLKQTGRLA